MKEREYVVYWSMSVDAKTPAEAALIARQNVRDAFEFEVRTASDNKRCGFYAVVRGKALRSG